MIASKMLHIKTRRQEQQEHQRQRQQCLTLPRQLSRGSTMTAEECQHHALSRMTPTHTKNTTTTTKPSTLPTTTTYCLPTPTTGIPSIIIPTTRKPLIVKRAASVATPPPLNKASPLGPLFLMTMALVTMMVAATTNTTNLLHIPVAEGYDVTNHTTYCFTGCDIPPEGVRLKAELMLDAADATGGSVTQAVYYQYNCVFKKTLVIELPTSWSWTGISLNISLINGTSFKDPNFAIIEIMGGILQEGSIIDIAGGQYAAGDYEFIDIGTATLRSASKIHIGGFTLLSTNLLLIKGSGLTLNTASYFKIYDIVLESRKAPVTEGSRPEPVIKFSGGAVTISGGSTLEVSNCEAILPRSTVYQARSFMEMSDHVDAEGGNVIFQGITMELYYTNEVNEDITQALLTISNHFDVTTLTFQNNRMVWHHYRVKSALIYLLQIKSGHVKLNGATCKIFNNSLDIYNGSSLATLGAAVMRTDNAFELQDQSISVSIRSNSLFIKAFRCSSAVFISIIYLSSDWKIEGKYSDVTIADNHLSIANMSSSGIIYSRLLELLGKLKPLAVGIKFTISGNILDVNSTSSTSFYTSMSYFNNIETTSSSGLKLLISSNSLNSTGTGAIYILLTSTSSYPFYTNIARNVLTSSTATKMINVPASTILRTCRNMQQGRLCKLNSSTLTTSDGSPCIAGITTVLECTVSKTPIRTLTGTNFTTTATISRAATSLTLVSTHTPSASHTFSSPGTATHHPNSSTSSLTTSLSPPRTHTYNNTATISIASTPTNTLPQTMSPTSIPTSTATNSISLQHTISQTASPITPTISLLHTSSTSMAYTTTEQLPMTISPTTSSSPTHQTITTPNTHTYIHSLSPTSTPSSTLPLPCAGVAVVSRGCELFGVASVAGSAASTPATSGNMCGSERVTVPYTVWSKGGGSARIVMPFVGAASPHVIARQSNASLVVASSVERGVVGSSRNTTDGTAWVELSVRYVGSTTLSGTTILVPIMVDRTMMVCGVSSGGAAVDVAVWLEPAPPVPPDVQTTVDIGVLGSAVGGGVLGVPSGIVRAGIANSMADMLACAEFDPTGDVDLISNPLSWAVGREELQYQRGSLLLTIILVGCAGVVCVVTLTGFYLTNRGSGVMGAVRRARLPSLPLCVVLLSCEVAVSPGVNVLLYEGSRSEDYVLSLCVLIPLALFLGLYAHRASVGMRVMIEKVPEADGEAAGGTAGALLRFALESSHRPVSLEEETKKANEAADDNDEDGVQVGDGERWLRGNFYFVAEKRWAAYGAIEAIVGPLVAVLEGIPLTTKSRALCIGRPAAMSVLLILLLALLLWRHPFAVRLQQWTSVIVTGGLLIASSLVVANGIAPSEELQNGAGRVIGVVSIIIMLFGAIDVVTVLLSLVPSLRVKLGIKARSLQDTIDEMRRAATNARRRHQMFRQQPAVVPLPTIIEGTSEEDDASEDGSEGSGSEDQVVVDNEKREYSCEEDAVVELTAMEICLQLEEEEHQQQQQHEEQQQRAAKHRRSVIGKRTIKNNKPKRDDCGGVTKTFSELFKNLRDDEL